MKIYASFNPQTNKINGIYFDCSSFIPKNSIEITLNDYFNIQKNGFNYIIFNNDSYSIYKENEQNLKINKLISLDNLYKNKKIDKESYVNLKEKIKQSDDIELYALNI